MIIDSHCHVYPHMNEIIEEKLKSFPLAFDKNLIFSPLKKIEKGLNKIKPQYNAMTKHYTNVIHDLQVKSRHLPEYLIPACDTAIALMGAPKTVIVSSPEDLFTQMNENKIDFSVIIAHPPYIPNLFVLQLANNHPHLIPFVNIPYNTANSTLLLEHYIELGAKGLKIHVASDGGEIQSDHYLSLLEIANKHKLPVIIHTGCIHLKPLYKDPEMGHAEKFTCWFQDYPNIQFVMAHMNYHHPEMALEIMQSFSNTMTDTSWQPKEAIVKAINKIGDDRILFGSDWPLIGNNIKICLDRIYQAVDEQLISLVGQNKILGENAKKLLGL